MSNQDLSRRAFINTAGKAGVVAGLSGSVLTALANTETPHKKNDTSPDPIPYKQRALPYAFAALEPAIDAMTMEIHYTKHAATYAKNLAEAVDTEKVDISKVTLEDLLASISKYSVKMRNNAGGHYNHSLFWELMTSPGKTTVPSDARSTSIQRYFGSLDAMKTKFNDAAKGRF